MPSSPGFTTTTTKRASRCAGTSYLLFLTAAERHQQHLPSPRPSPGREPDSVSLGPTGSSSERKGGAHALGLPVAETSQSFTEAFITSPLTRPSPAQPAPSIRSIDPVSPRCGTCLLYRLSGKDGRAGKIFQPCSDSPVPERRYKVRRVSGLLGRKCSAVDLNEGAPPRGIINIMFFLSGHQSNPLLLAVV